MLLTCHNVTVPQRLGSFSAQVSAGELVHLVGPNGAGKSTLLATLAGIVTYSGTITFLARPLQKWRPAALADARAWLAQQQPPLHRMPVWHFLELHQSGIRNQLQEADILYFCHQLQVESLLCRMVGELSGGEWQRVRVLGVLSQVMQSMGRLLLLDEPMSALDLTHQKALDRCLQRIIAAGITVIASSHDINHSLSNATQVWLMKQGKILEQGPAEQVLIPVQLSKLYGINFQLLRAGNTRWILPCD